MRAKRIASCGWSSLGRWLLAALTFSLVACGDNDYYFVNELKGQGDTVLLHVLFACGALDVTWNGAFSGDKKPYADLALHHNSSNDCGEDERVVPFDVGPMKQAFRVTHDDPLPLGLRVPPYYEEQGAICIANLFQEEEFKGHRCK